jgi:Bacterial protein of unknown function (DUF899)/Protein of unknown function (DUF554)
MRGLGTLLNVAAIGVGASVGTLLGDCRPQRLRDTLVAAMTAVGGLLVIAIGLRLLGLARIRVANLLPAVLLAPLPPACSRRPDSADHGAAAAILEIEWQDESGWEKSMMPTQGNLPEVVSREEWLAARKELLAREKELTRARDRVTADRRRLPMVRVDKPYIFEGPDGKVDLLDLFQAGSNCMPRDRSTLDGEQARRLAGHQRLSAHRGRGRSHLLHIRPWHRLGRRTARPPRPLPRPHRARPPRGMGRAQGARHPPRLQAGGPQLAPPDEYDSSS